MPPMLKLLKEPAPVTKCLFKNTAISMLSTECNNLFGFSFFNLLFKMKEIDYFVNEFKDLKTDDDKRIALINFVYSIKND